MAGKKKCQKMNVKTEKTLAQVKLELANVVDFNEYTAEVFEEILNTDQTSDQFAELKDELCEAVSETKDYYAYYHKAAESYKSQLEKMVKYRGCRKMRDTLKSSLAKITADLEKSYNDLEEYKKTHHQNANPALNCAL